MLEQVHALHAGRDATFFDWGAGVGNVVSVADRVYGWRAMGNESSVEKVNAAWATLAIAYRKASEMGLSSSTDTPVIKLLPMSEVRAHGCL